MSSMILEQLRSQALELPETERAELAHDLVASLDGPPDVDASAEWEKELLRRLDQVEEGSATTVDRAEFTQTMRARLSQN
jgi:putative addiction module component (TIGR02574 family)